LPFCEQKPLSDLMEQGMIVNSQGTGISDLTFLAPRLSFYAHNQKIPWMLCPSSPLPQTEILAGKTQPTCVVPSYVGISGATNHGSNVISTELAFFETRLKQSTGQTAATANVAFTPPNSVQSWGGMLTPNECYGMSACIDGTSNTMLVSEKSDYFYSRHQGN